MSVAIQPAPSVTLLGPQTMSFGQLREAIAGLEVEGMVAVITAGWQEQECDDHALRDAIGLPSVNLALHARSEEVAAEDPELWAALNEKQRRLRLQQDFYRIRLDAVDDAARAIAVRHVAEEVLADERAMTVSQLRHIDQEHLHRCVDAHADFDGQWRPVERPAVAKHHEELVARVAEAALVVIAGGHVVSQLNRIRLFGLHRVLESKPLIAWSAGAMALAERIVLFHDAPPFGKNIAQVVDAGLGLCPGVVVMPHLDQRVRVTEAAGIARFAQRMAPARCLGFNPDARATFRGGALTEASVDRLCPSGEIERGWRP